MRSGKVVEPLPFVQLLLQIDIVFVRQKLIEFLFVGPVQAFDFAIELGTARLDVNVSGSLVLDMPVELGLKFIRCRCVSVGYERGTSR